MSEIEHQPAKLRKPILTFIGLLVALVDAGLSIYIYDQGYDSGFEGFGAMVIGTIFAVLGLVPVLLLWLFAYLRQERLLKVNLISLTVWFVSVILVYNH